MPISDYFYRVWAYFKSHLLQLNLFNSGIQDELIIQKERRSTRLYLALLIISIVILVFYYSVTPYTHTVVIKNPTFVKYSTLVKEISLQCSCKKISVKYEQFVQIQPSCHELCQSDFVSNKYIKQLFILYEQSWNNSNSTDFRRIAVFQFQTLRALCQLTNETIENKLKTFLQTEFVQPQLIPQELLRIQIGSLFADFVDMTSKTFLRTLKFIQDTTAQNLFMTGASLTSVLPREHRIYNTPYSGMNYTFENGSSCTCSSSTATSCMVLSTFNNDIVHGFHTGCYMMNALLKSTLEVFYNQTFINILTNSSDDFKKLNSSISNLTIEILLSQMFVTHWSNQTFFEQYFNHCTPSSCQYTVTERYDFLLIITILIGLFGGLSSVFKIIATFIIIRIWPIILKFIARRQTPVTQFVENERLSVNDRIKEYFRLIKKKIIELNLFKSIPPSQDENILRQERYTTRIYLILLLLTVMILTIFTSIKPQTIRVIIESPSLADFIQLYDQYPLTLDCPCSQPAVDKQFISDIKPQYHEVCLSEFVSSNWINAQFYQPPPVKHFGGVYFSTPIPIILTDDIRYQSQFRFQLLSTLCHMANQTIQDSLQSFYRTKFVTGQVLSSQSFQTQIDLIVEQFKRTVPESFQRTLNLLKTNFETNLFVTPMNSDFKIQMHSGQFDFTLNEYQRKWPEKLRCNTNQQFCRCLPSSFEECYENIVIRDNDTTYNISGMFQAWFPLQSLLMSTLECFYQDTCLSKIIQYINTTASPINFTTLKSSSLSLNNNENDTIESLAKNLFIQSWNNKSSFESYFNHCRPLTCQYTYESRLNLIYIVTTIIGLIGGVNVFLELLLPYVVKLVIQIWNYVLHRQRRQSISMRTRFYRRLRTLFISGKQTMVELNLFASIPPSKDPNIIRRNRHTTRVYLVLLITAFFILILYTSLRQVTITAIVKSPSASKYTELFLQYPLTLQCPCSRIAIKYNQFISQIEPQYHQICSSVFISPEWLESMSYSPFYDLHPNAEYNFLKVARMQFQIVTQLCTLSKKLLNTSMSIFDDTDFITLGVISRDEFNVRTETIIEQFKKKASNEFTDVLKLIKVTNHGNQLATVRSSNWKFITKYLNSPIQANTEILILTLPQKYGAENCSCGIQSNCSQLSELFFHIPNQPFRQLLLGLRFGCLILDAVLESSLACLYNQTCLDMMQTSVYHSQPVPAEILTYSPLFPPNTTIEKILSQLFVSEWLKNKSFDLYFNVCAPQSCQYSYSMQYNPIYVVTTLIALFGGLTEGLHFVLYYIQLIIIKFIDRRKKKNQVAPDSNPLDIAVIDRDNNTIAMDSVSPATTIQSGVNLVNEQTKSRRRYRNRAIIVCLCLLSVAAIVTISVMWLTNRNEEQELISTTTRTTQINTISTVIESTSILTNKCYMTLKHQSQTYPTGLSPTSVITGDFNQDSIVDLAVTNYDSHTLSIMLGNGDGTFQTQKIYPTGNRSGPKEITTGYFNNDTLLDLAVILNVTKGIVIFFGVATNILFISPPYTFPDYNNIPVVIAASDLNNDGFFDLVVSHHRELFNTGNNLNIFLNLGDGRQFKRIFSGANWANDDIISIIIGDFHNNGNGTDLGLCTITGEVMTHRIYNYDLQIRNSGTMRVMYAKPSILVKGKFNDDEFDDMALVSYQPGTLQVLHNYYRITFIHQIYLTYSYPTSITRINFNNDTIDDLAVLSCDGTVTVFLGTKSGMFDRHYLSFEMNTSNSSRCSQSLKVADLNQDGRDDLVFIDVEINSIRVLLGTPCNE